MNILSNAADSSTKNLTTIAAAPEVAFADAMHAAGLDYHGSIISDGRLHRIKVNGDRQQNSWYVLHDDGIAAGTFGCWKRGIRETWCSKSDDAMTAEERAERDQRWKKQQEIREAERRRQQDAASSKAQAILDAAQPATSDHPYLVRKHVQAYPGVKIGPWPQRKAENCLLLPLRTAAGKLSSVQAILPEKIKIRGEDRDKDFLDGGAKAGAFFVIGDLEESPVVLICEGYATGASLHEATGYAVAVAFDAGNIAKVASVLKALYPHPTTIMICGDNDRKDDGSNPGMTAALAASKKAGVRVCIPEFADGEKGSDFNDLASLHGIDRVCGEIEAALTDQWMAGAPPHAPESVAPGSSIGSGSKKLPPLVYERKGEKRLTSQQKAAGILAKMPEFEQIRYHAIHHDFYHFNKTAGIFERKPALISDSAVYRAIRKYSDDFPFGASYVSGVAKCLTWETVTDFEPLKDHIGFKNGVLRLSDKKLFPHDPSFGLTSVLPYDWLPDAPEPTAVIKWLLDTVGGHPDRVQVLRAVINACITGRADLQRFVELVGPGGGGKGTFLRLLTSLVGFAAVHSTDLKSLEGNRFETAKIFGKKIVFITDAERWHGDVSMLKAITGQDRIRFEEKHKQAGESFEFAGMVIIAGNQHTESSDYSSGIQRRRITIPFDHVVPAHQRRDLGAEFEPLLPGVAAWALAMPRDEVTNYLRNTDGAARSLCTAKMDALAATNSIAAWLLDNVVFDESAKTKVGYKKRITRHSMSESRIEYEHAGEWLYPNFVAWCEENGKKPVALNVFSRTAVEIASTTLGWGFVRKGVSSSGAHIAGLRLRRDEELMRNYEELMRNSPQNSEDYTIENYELSKNEELLDISTDFPCSQTSESPSRVENQKCLEESIKESLTVPHVHNFQSVGPHSALTSTSRVPHSALTSTSFGPLETDIIRYLSNVSTTASDDETYRQVHRGQAGRTLALTRIALAKLVAAGEVDKINDRYRRAAKEPA